MIAEHLGFKTEVVEISDYRIKMRQLLTPDYGIELLRACRTKLHLRKQESSYLMHVGLRTRGISKTKHF